MSFPTIPNISPQINLSFQDTINLLLSSIAFEELGLAHIINAEAEKIQYVVGTLTPGVTPPTISELIAINQDVRKTLQTVIQKEMLLQFKLESVIDIIPEQEQKEQKQKEQKQKEQKQEEQKQEEQKQEEQDTQSYNTRLPYQQ